MSEKELLQEITRLSREAATLDDALAQTRALLADKAGSILILVRKNDRNSSYLSEKAVADFLNSRNFPFRALYTESIVVHGEAIGRLIACFGSWESSGEFQRNLAAHMGQQFGLMLERTRSKLQASSPSAVRTGREAA